jgi:hypothetical protein
VGRSGLRYGKKGRVLRDWIVTEVRELNKNRD